MIKKILPIVTLIGASALIVGCSQSSAKVAKRENFIQNLNTFHEDVKNYTDFNSENLTKTAFNKYALSIQTENLEDVVNNQNLIQPLNDDEKTELSTTDNSEETNDHNTTQGETTEQSSSAEENSDAIEGEIAQISTLYSLSSDIENSCDEFCVLKENIADAIVETQKLISKVQQKEIELTNEQRLFITEQAQQLKNLGRQLSNITTELSFNLSDLNQLMTANSQDLDNLSLKYLVVLDNLVNGNEMLQSGLSSLNLINQMFNMRSPVPSNNQGRVLYGFQHNNNPPIIKDYYINENGEMIENSQDNKTENSENNQTTENSDEVDANAMNENKTNIDTYKNTRLNSNIDSYYNYNLPRNIDTFFNTALLDNEFMYGNGYGYGYGGMNNPYGAMNPNMAGYNNYERNNAINGDVNHNNTQNIGQGNVNEINNTETKKEKKKIKLQKNIDTYKDENEPDIKTKLANIKNSITGFFTKFKKSDLDDKIDNPVYRYRMEDTERN